MKKCFARKFNSAVDKTGEFVIAVSLTACVLLSFGIITYKKYIKVKEDDRDNDDNHRRTRT
jgi:hypothetical protein